MGHFVYMLEPKETDPGNAATRHTEQGQGDQGPENGEVGPLCQQVYQTK